MPHSTATNTDPNLSNTKNIQPEKQLLFPSSSFLQRSPHNESTRSTAATGGKRYPREHAPKRPCRTAARCCSWTASGTSPSPSAATASLYSPSTRYAPSAPWCHPCHVPSLFWDRLRVASDPTGLNLLVTLDWKGFVRAWVNVWQRRWFCWFGCSIEELRRWIGRRWEDEYGCNCKMQLQPLRSLNLWGAWFTILVQNWERIHEKSGWKLWDCTIHWVTVLGSLSIHITYQKSLF